jgi:cytochrome bd ubiquinol oxidase subunit II
MTVVLAVVLPIVLLYQGWTYHVFRGRLRGPRVGEDEAVPGIPSQRSSAARTTEGTR